ncbi:lymphocyte antigen 6 complex locus protein G5c [Talpa occidentalis]|uniref:lymphocyte antigen 6 complex locus protein G5c n=1 Tax=Talpa occidentalis TaxID=50954 RepID=UPI00188F3714|nr:lymphocyte antigen 6 complex locus protein G5c [Talpa occidentalis]
MAKEPTNTWPGEPPSSLYFSLIQVCFTHLKALEAARGGESVRQDLPYPAQPPKYLRCYRCLLETKELGCLLGSDICLVPAGSSCLTLHIKNSSGADILVSDCRRKEQMHDCAHTRTSPVFGYWIFSQCCFLDFCNNPENRVLGLP